MEKSVDRNGQEWRTELGKEKQEHCIISGKYIKNTELKVNLVSASLLATEL